MNSKTTIDDVKYMITKYLIELTDYNDWIDDCGHFYMNASFARNNEINRSGSVKKQTMSQETKLYKDNKRRTDIV